MTVPFTTTGSEVAWSSRFTTMRVDDVVMPDGQTAQREVAEHLSAVGVVPLFDDGTVALLRQYRHPTSKFLLEIPAGLLDVDGEDPEVGARRELAEEVGLACTDLRVLTTFWNSAGWTTEQTTVYLATGLTEADAPDGFVLEHEEAAMEIVRLPLSDLVAEAHLGTITDAKTLVGILLAAAVTNTT